MRVGVDITALYVAQAGIFTYEYHLIQALLRQDATTDYLLVDYSPIHGGMSEPLEPVLLDAPNARVVHCRGLRHRRLARWGLVQRLGLRPLAETIDRVLFAPWAVATRSVMRRRLASVLAGVDVFHSSDVLLWHQPGALNVVTLYDLTALVLPEYHTAETRELQQHKLRFAREEADVVVVPSEATRRDVVTHLGIPPARVRVVYGGADSAFRPLKDREKVARALAPLGLQPGGYILHVGTIEPRKNLARLVAAYGLVRRMLPPPLPDLVLVGTTGWQFQEVFDRVRALGLEQAVRFVGRVDANLLPAIYNGALLFVYPSLYEGFGLPVVEAMACGVPVVTSSTSSLPEVVGDAGLLVEPRDVGALAEGLAGLLRDPERRAALAAAGLRRAASFTWERAATKMRQVYECASSSN